jgi:negative regulator of flagellin synthesis FlgM
MKIEQSTQATPVQPLSKETRSTPVKKTERTSDEIQLSNFASQLLASDDSQPFNAGQVAKIKQAISEGKFSINADAIADRLITSARELVDSRHSS